MTKQFTLVQLRYFQTVAQLENMTAAAAALNVTQSTLSAAIGQLEREMGVQLFTRVPRRGLQLTSGGRRLLRGCQALLEEADLLYQSVREEDEQLVGELNVGIFSPLAPFRAPVILQNFEAKHPGVDVTFLEADQETLRRALDQGRCELALMYDIGLGPELERQVVERIPPHILVAADHPLAEAPEREVSLHQFAEDPFILLDLPHTREYFLSLFQLAGIEPNIRHRATGYETVRSFVARGHGYSVLNQRLHHDLTYAGGRVVPLRITEDLPEIKVLLVSPPGVRPTAKARAFAEVTRRLYGIGG
jgi:DNA-binding transcriptional LysR family regulator